MVYGWLVIAISYDSEDPYWMEEVGWNSLNKAESQNRNPWVSVAAIVLPACKMKMTVILGMFFKIEILNASWFLK